MKRALRSVFSVGATRRPLHDVVARRQEVGGLGGLGRRTACPTTPPASLTSVDDILAHAEAVFALEGAFFTGSSNGASPSGSRARGTSPAPSTLPAHLAAAGGVEQAVGRLRGGDHGRDIHVQDRGAAILRRRPSDRTDPRLPANGSRGREGPLPRETGSTGSGAE